MAAEFPNARRIRGAAFALLAVAGIGLSGCSSIGDMFSSSPEPKIPGKRLTVMELETKLEVDPATADTPVILPKPFENTDWTQPGGTPDNAMYHLAAPGKLEKLWSTNAGEGSNDVSSIVASPIVAEGKVFVLDAEATVRAFDTKTGDRVWKRDLTPDDEDSDKARGGGIAYDDGKIFVTTGFGLVQALNAKTGDLLWTANAGVPFRASPTANGGRVFAITSDNQTLCVAEANGEILWKHRGISESAGILASTSPAVAGSIVIVPYSSGELYALRVENGTVLWSDSLTRTGNLTSLSELNDIAGRPVIDRDRVFAISHSGRFVSIDLRTGERVWTKDIAGVQTPWVAGEYVFLVTIDQEVVAVSRRDGRIRWLTKLDRWESPEDKSDPIEWSGPLLVSDRLIFVSTTGEAVSLSPYTGKVIGKIDLPGKTLIAPIVADGTVYILTDDARLVAYR